ncbi:type II secretion system protein, partial [bacterium]|nr:type II secretion system protein [bacterium]
MKRWNRNERKFYSAFTLAEVLITMAVIGVVAAVTVPALVINIQERVQNEQARSAKYKLTKATDKMKSLGLLD